MSKLLVNLIKDNPNTRIFAQVDNRCAGYSDEGYSWNLLDAKHAYITDVYVGKNGVYPKDDWDTYDIFVLEVDEDDEEAYEDFLCHLDISWERAIIVYVDPLDEE